MKKIYLVIAGAFLILLVITTMLLSLIKKPASTNRKDSAFPTGIPDQGKTGQPLPATGGDQGLKDLSNESNLSNQSNESNLSNISPFETSDFKMQFNANLNKIVVEKKTVDAEQKFIDWANENNYSQLTNDLNKVIFIKPGQDPEFNPVIEFLNIFMNMGQGSEQSLSPTPTIQPQGPTSSVQPSTSFTYYAQCGDQGSLPLPDGGTLCSAGCGPTTVAMISSSYVDKKYDPKAIINLYESSDYLLGNDGSRYTDAHELLKGLGLKTTDYLVFDSEKAETVVPELRKYLASGWTFFTLASFCSEGCGHYFWITDIDNQGNIYAYDPAYGRYQIPYNENSRYPYPLYRLAFGVKK